MLKKLLTLLFFSMALALGSYADDKIQYFQFGYALDSQGSGPLVTSINGNSVMENNTYSNTYMIMYGKKSKDYTLGGLDLSAGYIGDFKDFHDIRMQAKIISERYYNDRLYFYGGVYVGYGKESRASRSILRNDGLKVIINTDPSFVAYGTTVGAQYYIDREISLDIGYELGQRLYRNYYGSGIDTIDGGEEKMNLGVVRASVVFNFY
jgi:hypothetical protein